MRGGDGGRERLSGDKDVDLDDDSEGGGVGDIDRVETAGLVGGAINIDSLRSVVVVDEDATVVNCERGLDLGGEWDIIARCLSN